jgi:hypothetical protein
MTFPARMILIATLLLSLGARLAAQETTTAKTTTQTDSAVTATAAKETVEAGDPVPQEPRTPAEQREVLRSEFNELIRNYPPELATLLVLEPNLLGNEQFLTAYPDLASFVREHPEVLRNPQFYLYEFRVARERALNRSVLDEMIEPMVAFIGFILFAYGVTWLVRTLIEQRRWSRLAKTQSEVHNKILDRFDTTAEVLEYVRSEAGSRFLESAPIPLHAERTAQNVPLLRVMWSIQLGVIVVAGSIGLLLLGLLSSGDGAQGFLGLSAIAVCVGAGFIASAFISLFLSRRLGLWQDAAPALDEPGQMR